MLLTDYGWTYKLSWNDKPRRFTTWENIPNSKIGHQKIWIKKNGKTVTYSVYGSITIRENAIPNGNTIEKTYVGSNFYQNTRTVLKKWMEKYNCTPDWTQTPLKKQ